MKKLNEVDQLTAIKDRFSLRVDAANFSIHLRNVTKMFPLCAALELPRGVLGRFPVRSRSFGGF